MSDGFKPLGPFKETGASVTHLENYRPKKVEEVWECECGGQKFWLNKDGAIMCTGCARERTTLIWGYRT